MVETRVKKMVWTVRVVVDVEDGTWNWEQGWSDVLINVPTAGTPDELQPEYNSTAEETCSD